MDELKSKIDAIEIWLESNYSKTGTVALSLWALLLIQFLLNWSGKNIDLQKTFDVGSTLVVMIFVSEFLKNGRAKNEDKAQNG